jgi:hypothetical protein
MQEQMRQEGRMMTSATQLLWKLVLQEMHGMPQLEQCEMGAVEVEGGVRGIGALQKHARMDNESKGDGIGGAPKLEPHETGAVES